ncbi:hypothetical protein ACIA8O_35890 [Kitasatospora sp. NPDC051853]|uniref:hypothetical protein n=1 Tax=Kitasatospora sp. NPDC051853 TaxID=3364058 RepID=UPI0037A91610
MESEVTSRTSGWILEPFADLSAAFVFFESPVRVAVLDRLSWYVLELCDGRPVAGITERVRALGLPGGPERAGRVVAERLGTLRASGLLA